ncbi:TonB-dependent receptor [Noviherbaspirillum malthae]|uniref:TonB-dependent receptor n=1 Tax=Noviherbaspirillum malthae TaxID=1260987 RepID=UPI001E3FA424|nr:TonB-dependent siderophore receptor [Noviherbaspirillum malthae]
MTRSKILLAGPLIAAGWMALPAIAQNAAETVLPAVVVSGEREKGLRLDVPSSAASRLDLTPREVPASVSSLEREDIVERSLHRAQDVAIRLPGVTESPAPGNGGTSLVARGFAGHNSVAQLVDGTRLIVAAGTITYPFSTWPLESVEVLSGPASVLYGDGSIGAAVNYVTKKPLFERTQREAMLGVGSYGAIQAGIGLRGPVNDAVAYSLYIDSDKTGGYRSEQSHERQNLSAAVAVRPGRDLKLTFMLDAGHNEDSRYFGVPLVNGRLDDRLRRTGFNVDDAIVKYNDRVWRGRIEYQVDSNIKLRNETYYLTSKRHWRNAESYAYIPATGRVSRSDYLEILHDQEQAGNRFDASIDGHIAGLKNRLVVGLDWYKTRLVHTNNAPYGGASIVDPFSGFEQGRFISPVPTTPGRRAELETKAFFAEDVLDMTQSWKLVAGLRQERMDLDNRDLRTQANLSRDYDPTTGRLGVVWSASDALSLYGQYGTGTDPLSGSLSLPNNGNVFNLAKGKQVEVGAKGSLPLIKGEWTFAVYGIKKRNLLSRDPGNPAVTLQIGQQSSKGIEFGLAAEPVKGVTIAANAAWLRARYDEFRDAAGMSYAGNKVTGVPERTANIWAAYRFLPGWQIGAGARYVGERQSNNANTASLPSYTVLDAILNVEVKGNTVVSLGIRNLANRDYVLSGSGSVRWLLGEPRTAQLSVRTEF